MYSTCSHSFLTAKWCSYRTSWQSFQIHCLINNWGKITMETDYSHMRQESNMLSGTTVPEKTHYTELYLHRRISNLAWQCYQMLSTHITEEMLQYTGTKHRNTILDTSGLSMLTLGLSGTFCLLLASRTYPLRVNLLFCSANRPRNRKWSNTAGHRLRLGAAQALCS